MDFAARLTAKECVLISEKLAIFYSRFRVGVGRASCRLRERHKTPQIIHPHVQRAAALAEFVGVCSFFIIHEMKNSVLRVL